MNTLFKSEEELLIEINEFIHLGKKKSDYHFQHIKLVDKYAKLLNKKLGYHLNTQKITFISLMHDMLKERSLDPKTDGTIMWKNHQIPQDLNRYVRMNIDVLDQFEMGDYFNTDAPLHALAAGIWIYKELGIKDPEIIYPIMFHSCPIIAIYENLPIRTQHMIDVIMLADKLSSNYLNINLLESEVKIDLDLLVFGKIGNEFNYTLGLYVARLIAMGKSNETQTKEASEYYFKRLSDVNPLVSKSYVNKQLGVNKKWPKRKSRAFRTQ